MVLFKSISKIQVASKQKYYSFKKNIIGITFLILGTVIYSQGNLPVFALFNGENEFLSNNCFEKSTDFSVLNIKLIKGKISDIKKIGLTISLSEYKAQQFLNYKDFENFDLGYWLKNNEAFINNNSLTFNFEIELSNEEKKNQQIVHCIKSSAMALTNPENYIKTPDYIKMSVYFATDRNDTMNEDANERFGTKRSTLKYGVCEVSIPYNHKIGEIEKPSFWRLEFSEDPKKHIVLQGIELLNNSAFFKKMSTSIKKSSKKSSFLFIHGYNVSFAAAAKRTAQISYDLLFDGEAVFYSWPSRGATTAYTVDEANIEWAQANIRNFLEDYLLKSEAEEIYLVAHSMGNRGLTKALISLISERPELKNKIKEIILAAPDIDADVFKRDIAPQMVSSIKKPITLYVSSEDMALKASRKVHGSQRAGDSGLGVVLINGVETIDASGIDTSFLSHSYFAETTSIIADIFELIKTGKRAFERKKLKLIKFKSQTYWKVEKD